jgi:hypothetical protein
VTRRLAMFGSVGICCVGLVASGCATPVERAAEGMASAAVESASAYASISPSATTATSGTPPQAASTPTVKLTFTNSLRNVGDLRQPVLKWEVTYTTGEFISPKPSDEAPAGLNNLVQSPQSPTVSVTAGLTPGQWGGLMIIRPSISSNGGWTPMRPMKVEYAADLMGWYTEIPQDYGCTSTKRFPILRKYIGSGDFWYWLNIQCLTGRIDFEISDTYIR